MALIPVGSERTVWMFPRNIRAIHPWKVAQIAAQLRMVSDGIDWSGNQSLQTTLTKALEQSGLKRAGHQYDPKSGGARTYLAQLGQLGLVFMRGDRVFFTKAGLALAEGMHPLPALREQLMRLQFPSPYSMGRNVKIDSRIRVKPVVFVLQMLNDPRLGGWLTEEELCVPVVFGHNHDCLNLCVEKVLALRAAGAKFSDSINLQTDLSLPRTKSADENIQANIRDIANTLKNYLSACLLVTEEVEADGVARIRMAAGVDDLLAEALQRLEEFISNPEVEESFQRAFGTPLGTKDTRNLDAPTGKGPSPEDALILAQFFELCGERVFDTLPTEFVDRMVYGFGFQARKVIDVVTPHLAKSLDLYESTFLGLATGGTRTALDFEVAVVSLLRDRLGLDARHTGQHRRPNGTIGGYSDALVLHGQAGDAAIVDAKAYREYTLPVDDYRAMHADYAVNFRELDGGAGALAWCGYVSGGFSRGFESRARTLSREVAVPVSSLSARFLLDFAKTRGPSDAQATFQELRDIGHRER